MPLTDIFIYDDGIGKVSVVDAMGSAKTVVNAARVSFGQDNNLPFDQKDAKLVKYLWEHKHTSPFEHCVMTFRFVVPIFVARQHMRHRTWKFNEISARYTEIEERFYMPNSFRKQHEKNRQASKLDDQFDPDIKPNCDPFSYYAESFSATKLMKDSIQKTFGLYKMLLDSGICREQARMILPVSMYTEYYGTIDLHNLFKFIELRNHEGAQWEIQVVAKALESFAKELYPDIFEAIGK